MSVKKNLTSKDRPVSTPGEDMNDDLNESELSAPDEIMSFRADAARGNYLSKDRPDLRFSQRKYREPSQKPVKKDHHIIVRMANHLKDLENRRIQLEFKFEASDSTGPSSTRVPYRGQWRCRRVT